MKKILLIDNYDSFTYNLLQCCRELKTEVFVQKNDEITVSKAQKIDPDFLLFSPGPGTAECQKDIGNGLEIFEAFRGKIPILGVCLGHQMIGKYFGAKIKKVPPAHGKKSIIQILQKSGLFQNFPDQIEGMRYHSLVVDINGEARFIAPLRVTAKTEDSLIMALEIPEQKIYGIQFHPESIGTKIGRKILENFLSL